MTLTTTNPQERIYSPWKKPQSHGAQKKQKIILRSSSESEYRALAKTMSGAIWLRRLTNELRFGNKGPTTIWCDKQSCIKIAKNPMFYNRTKHFEIDLHFTKQNLEDKSIKVEFLQTSDQLANILTKPLSRQKFERCRKKLNVKSINDIEGHN